ncbi:uncharacterized protein N7511_002351 [Penicillium nucicola]|uniref:uncharacterized protein n=1 Tax=Penicillium nucicola TaxID=1850975 RepID=UPI002545A7FB|nr:uncharacterized protein N7511_002351 [Penicillium nucicola]KAJ5770300.1 hypothetical protein N7511_002351 [Penicillium nucicola]
MTNESYIPCAHCGLDFRSQGGLETHVQNNHNMAKRVSCSHCDFSCSSASGIIVHLESGNCPVVNKDGQHGDEVKAEGPAEQNFLDAGRFPSSSESDTLQSAPSEDDEQEGGVRLDLASASFQLESNTGGSQRGRTLASKPSIDFESGGVSIYQSISVYAPENIFDRRVAPIDPPLGSLAKDDEPTPDSSYDLSTSPGQPIPVFSRGSLAHEHYQLTDTFDESGSLPSISSLETCTDSRPASNFPLYHPATSLFRSKLRSPPAHVPEQSLEGYSAEQPESAVSGAGTPSASTTSHQSPLNVDPQEFWNADKGCFVCNCGSSFETAREFRIHIALGDDSAIKDCPRCFRRFQNLAALVAHVEAPLSKCAAFADDLVENEINEITRGFATFRSHRSDVEMADDLIDLDTTSETKEQASSDDLDDDMKLAEELHRLKFEER